MVSSRRPACVTSGAISTQSPCVEMWTNAREMDKMLLGNVSAHVLSVFREALVGVGVMSAPPGSWQSHSPSPDIGVGRWVGLDLVSYWGEG